MNELTAHAFIDELVKIADASVPGGYIDPSELADPNDPNDPITRYQSMQRRRPIARDIVREGAIGAAAVPALSTLRDVIGKGAKDTFKRGDDVVDAAGKVLRRGSQLGPGGYGRKAVAGAAIGALSAGMLPVLRSHMALKAEEENVKQQLGITPGSGVRSAVRRTVGVG